MALLDMLQKMATDLVVRIAEGEGLDVDEMLKKYLGNEAKPPKAKATRAAKVTVSDTTVTKCTATTAKGKPCSLNALPGTCTCRVHTKKGEDEESGPGPSTGPIKKPKEKKEKKTVAKKKKRDDPPMHTHDLDETVHEDCELCHTHGNPLASSSTPDVPDVPEEEEEFETVTSPRRSLRSRLMAAAIEEENDYEEE